MMQDKELLERITVDPAVLTGKPVVRGTRLAVQFILNLLAHDESVEAVLIEYPYLTRDDIRACILFANRVLDDTRFIPLAKAA